MAYDNRHEGLTYGPGDARIGLSVRSTVLLDEEAPAELQGTADATWGLEKDVYGVLVTKNGAAVVHGAGTVNVVCEASMDTEGVATTKLIHKVLYVQAMERAMGVSTGLPTVVGTDNSANLLVSRGQGSAGRSKHSLRRWANITKRLEEREIYLAKVDTENMPADFLTKFLGKAKLALSLRRATNSGKALP